MHISWLSFSARLILAPMPFAWGRQLFLPVCSLDWKLLPQLLQHHLPIDLCQDVWCLLSACCWDLDLSGSLLGLAPGPTEPGCWRFP